MVMGTDKQEFISLNAIDKYALQLSGSLKTTTVKKTMMQLKQSPGSQELDFERPVTR